jgi:hypothetical protein
MTSRGGRRAVQLEAAALAQAREEAVGLERSAYIYASTPPAQSMAVATAH